MTPTGGTSERYFRSNRPGYPHPVCSELEIVISEWRSVVAVSLNIGGGVHLIKPAKLYMCMQTHYKHDEDGHTVPGVHGHGSVPLSHLRNVVTRIGLHIHKSASLNSMPLTIFAYLKSNRINSAMRGNFPSELFYLN